VGQRNKTNGYTDQFLDQYKLKYGLASQFEHKDKLRECPGPHGGIMSSGPWVCAQTNLQHHTQTTDFLKAAQYMVLKGKKRNMITKR
jgi:hypothetical protein